MTRHRQKSTQHNVCCLSHQMYKLNYLVTGHRRRLLWASGNTRSFNHLRCHACFAQINMSTNFNSSSSCRDSCNPRSFGGSNLRLLFASLHLPIPTCTSIYQVRGAWLLVSVFVFAPSTFWTLLLNSDFLVVRRAPNLHPWNFFLFLWVWCLLFGLCNGGSEGVLFFMPFSSGCFFFFFFFAVDFSKVWQRSCLLFCRLSSAGLVYSLQWMCGFMCVRVLCSRVKSIVNVSECWATFLTK
jgi:hypothetical protein